VKERDPNQGCRNAWGKITQENIKTMKSKRGLEHLISERWPRLKERAQHERNPQKLIAILEEIDDLLFNLEMRIASQRGRKDSRGDTNSKSFQQEPGAVLSDDAEIGSQ
jgi:hypothetical protein